MKSANSSIKFKIIAGYTLAAVLAIIGFWIIYKQLNSYAEINDAKNDNTQKLVLVGGAITGLYEAESLTRNIIQTSNTKKFATYKNKVDSILKTIDQLSEMSYDELQYQKIDSIKILIDSKNKNFKKLISIYEQRKEKGLKDNIIDQLKKSSTEYGNYLDLDRRLKKQNPATKSLIKKLLSWSKKDNEKRLTNQTLDSVSYHFNKVLVEVEQKEQKYERQIKARENKLLKNDQIITKQLRDLMAAIEDDERQKSIERIRNSNSILNKTSDLIIIIIAISIIIAIIFLILITKDISMSQQYRSELETEKSYTESLLKTRESIINTVTHDLRSPLNTVIGYSDLLEKTSLTSKQKYYLDHLKKSSDYILHLVNDLLDLSKLEAGRMIIETLPFSPEKLIQNTISSVIPFDDKKNLTISITSQDILKKQFLGDPFRIKQILTNLVNNAYKFTNNGSILINSQIIENGLAEKKLVISIKDTGIGISTTQQKYIFEEFSQGEDNTEKKYGGFGLGLAITKKIIKLLGGTIQLKSELNQGSNFIVSIPIELAKSQILEEEFISDEIKYFSNKKVLIVDDDPSQSELTSEVVSLAGLQYDIGSNGIEAIELLTKNSYDLVLTDIQMPKMDGFQLLKNIQNTATIKHLKVIALSGRVDTCPTEYEDAGFSGSLRKPYAPNDLLNLISSILEIETTNINNQLPEIKIDKTEFYSLKDLMLFTQGDSESLYAILDTFYVSTKHNLEQLQIAIKNQNLLDIKKISHKMLPMFRQIKATKSVRMLEKLENPEMYNLDTKNSIDIANQSVHEIQQLITTMKTTIAKA